ncbi:hypothetical protein RND71_034607 [Anisodus tanguticus]|uniref:Uncharacterized protein n=1 Tax=Anisodus tanguticus TaxID=243964 RepID=A0AAE1RB16_9SOLA|nr:hypothetical protein RND71_034607 [Anisodus tanguticus]
MSKATFPIATSNVRKFFLSEYKSWWVKVHERFLEDNLQSLVNAVGPITNVPQGHNEEAHQASKKRPSQDESDSSHGDHNFKRMRACPSSLEDTNSPVVEISDSVGNPSRTVTTHIKEPSNVYILVASHQSKPQDSSESVAGLDLQKSFPTSKSEQEATSIP